MARKFAQPEKNRLRALRALYVEIRCRQAEVRLEIDRIWGLASISLDFAKSAPAIQAALERLEHDLAPFAEALSPGSKAAVAEAGKPRLNVSQTRDWGALTGKNG